MKSFFNSFSSEECTLVEVNRVATPVWKVFLLRNFIRSFAIYPIVDSSMLGSFVAILNQGCYKSSAADGL